MPPGRKRASAHVFTSEDAEHERADEAKYTTYYCKFCGQHVMTSTCDDLSALPRRRTDGALMLDLAKHPTRILAALDAEVVAVREEALFCTGFLFITARAAHTRIKVVALYGIEQGSGLEGVS